MNVTQAANMSRSFSLASQRSDEQRQLPGGKVQWLAVPAIVCAAFSIELGLKALILRGGNAAHGHDLRRLFDALSEPVKLRITEACGDAGAFDASLDAIAGSFNEWRYIYERDTTEIDAHFLRRLRDAVQLALGDSQDRPANA